MQNTVLLLKYYISMCFCNSFKRQKYERAIIYGCAEHYFTYALFTNRICVYITYSYWPLYNPTGRKMLSSTDIVVELNAVMNIYM